MFSVQSLGSWTVQEPSHSGTIRYVTPSPTHRWADTSDELLSVIAPPSAVGPSVEWRTMSLMAVCETAQCCLRKYRSSYS
jgi:hypothetical protein